MAEKKLVPTIRMSLPKTRQTHLHHFRYESIAAKTLWCFIYLLAAKLYIQESLFAFYAGIKIQYYVFLMKHIGIWGKFTADSAVPSSKYHHIPYCLVLSVRLIDISTFNLFSLILNSLASVNSRNEIGTNRNMCFHRFLEILFGIRPRPRQFW